MKIIYSFFCSILFMGFNFDANGQTAKRFYLFGNISGVITGTIELSDHFGDDTSYIINRKKAEIINGKFQINGTLQYPLYVYLTYKNAEGKSIHSTEFFLSAGSQFFDANYDPSKSNLQAKITRSKSNDEYEKSYLPRFNEIRKKEQSTYQDYNLFEKIQTTESVAFVDSIQLERKKLTDIQDSIFYNYIVLNPKSYVGLWALAKRLELNYTVTDNRAFEALDEKLQRSFLGKTVEQKIANHKKTIVGAFFPDFTVVDIDSNETKFVNTNLEANTILFVDMWFSRCTPCIAQFPKLKEIYNLYKNKGFQIIGLSVKERSFQEWKDATKKHQFLWPQYLDTREFAIYKLNIQSFPTNFLIDSNGNIIARDLEPIQLKNILEKRYIH